MTWGGSIGEGGPSLGFWGEFDLAPLRGSGETSGSGDEVSDGRVSGGGWLPTSGIGLRRAGGGGGLSFV